MMYPYLTLNDDTEITHSELRPDGRVKVTVSTMQPAISRIILGKASMDIQIKKWHISSALYVIMPTLLWNLPRKEAS